MSHSTLKPTERTRLRRLPKRGSHEREQIYEILDEGFVCHVGFVVEGRPYVIPTGYARMGDQLLIHGSAASRTLRHLAKGFEACVAVTLLDGLVVARSAFHSSMNYRSVVLFGQPKAIREPEAKQKALDCLVEHLIPGRTNDARGPSEEELQATEILRLPIDEASAKIRTGPPVDDEDDLVLPVWAGVVPLALVPGEPESAPDLSPDIAAPGYVRPYRRPTRK